MTALKLIIFDCDGVMFDSKNANKAYYNHIREKFAQPPMDAEELEYVHMHHVMDSMRHIFRKAPEHLAEADAYRKRLDYTPYLQHMIMEPDLLEFLNFLRPAYKAELGSLPAQTKLMPCGYKTAISTNRTSTMGAVLQIFELANLFDKVVTAFDVTQPKPHPEALHQILAHFQCSVAESIYIGDSQVDRDHTEAVGMRLIAFKNQELPAEYHVRSFMEITRLPIFTKKAKGENET